MLIVILGHPAYPLMPWLLKPYAGSLDSKKERFNDRLSRCTTVECAVGRLKEHPQGPSRDLGSRQTKAEASLPQGPEPEATEKCGRRPGVWTGVAGCCAKTTIAPLDRVKILLQAHNQHYKHLGITAVICTYPLDMVRARLAFQVKGEHKYTGIIHAFKTIYTKEGGYIGFYRGLMPTVVGMAPYAGFSFFTFSTLKSIGLAQAPSLLGRPSLDNPEVLVLKTHVSLLCGGLAGAIAQTISYPLDVTRRRMQLGSALPDADKCLTMVQTLKYVYRHHGIRRGLYRGLSLNYIRCIPSQAVAFTTYEFMRQLLHLN
ncbi:graves disease carrier protein isoform X6 [Chelonia mydas]|uniref:graves disease carrier protein isoform X6 n=1 Tax=Chelonia mydas TaxID=8469 RepID=UPI001CA8E5C4|nr:graves disease carrier protein isoform X6 [Chelonia mydas]